MVLLSRAICFAVLSALVTAAFLIGAFVAALEGVGHAGLVAMMFAVSLALLTGRAGRVDARDSYLHGEHGSRMIARVRQSLFFALRSGIPFFAPNMVGERSRVFRAMSTNRLAMA
jgi:hypothetical protein